MCSFKSSNNSIQFDIFAKSKTEPPPIANMASGLNCFITFVISTSSI